MIESETNGTLAKNRGAMARFLEKLRDSGNVYLSCRAAGVPRATVYRWRGQWSTFAKEWDDALDDALDLLEAEAWRRARKNSDRLLMFLLAAHRARLYSPVQRQEITGAEGGAMIVNINTNLGADAV
jgi:hypothetical protein